MGTRERGTRDPRRGRRFGRIGLAAAAPCVLAACLASAVARAEPPPVERLRFAGLNLAGAEFNGSRIPGKFGKDYVYPAPAEIDALVDRGFNTIRLPFRWERLQRNLGWPLDEAELGRIERVVAQATGRGAVVILDPHNYGRYHGRKVGTEEVPAAAFGQFWAKLAERFKTNDRVVFGLMNEPFGIEATDWRRSAEAALEAIRATGARNLVLVPGTAWTGAHSWLARRDGASNADAMRDFAARDGAVAIEVHQYLDRDHSGRDGACSSETAGRDRLQAFTAWLRETGHKGFLGEFAAGSDPVCLRALDGMLDYVRDHADVWLGWTYWAGGAWWPPSYPFAVRLREDDAGQPLLSLLVRQASRR